MDTFTRIFLRVSTLSTLINTMYGIEPKIFIKFSDYSSLVPNGMFKSAYKKDDMYIEINLPHTLKWTGRRKALLDALVIHEYCHYIEDSQVSAVKRMKSMEMYNESAYARLLDEQRTWRRTKKLAKRLGMWNKALFKEIKGCAHSSNLQY